MSIEYLQERIAAARERLRCRPSVSFEFFPPKDDAMARTLWQDRKSVV